MTLNMEFAHGFGRIRHTIPMLHHRSRPPIGNGDYAVGIATIQEAFNLDPISQDDYKFYSTYGLDMPEGYSAEVEEQCKDVSYFLQIYANSFR